MVLCGIHVPQVLCINHAVPPRWSHCKVSFPRVAFGCWPNSKARARMLLPAHLRALRVSRACCGPLHSGCKPVNSAVLLIQGLLLLMVYGWLRLLFFGQFAAVA